MAERRMFAKTIIDSDAFLDMPLSAQALYFHLSMRADDDGFINNPKKIQRMIGASDDDFKLLLVKNFLIPFESGIVVIKHWKIHNYIQSDRYKPTVYQEEKSLLTIKKNRAYTLGLSEVDTECIHDGYTLEPQVRLGKDRLGKDSIGECNNNTHTRVEESDLVPKNCYGKYQNVFLTNEEYSDLSKELGEAMLKKCIEFLSGYVADTNKTYNNHANTIKRWVVDAVKEREIKASGKGQASTVHIDNQRTYDYDKLLENIKAN